MSFISAAFLFFEGRKKMRDKKLMPKPFHIRLTAGTEQRLKAISERTGVDRTTVARLALHSGLVAIAKTLPSTPLIENLGNNSLKETT